MLSRKFALLAAVMLVLASVPVIAGAAVPKSPQYDQVVSGATKITGTSVDALTISALFPNGVSASTWTAGNGARWTIPVSGSLKTDDTIRIVWTDGTHTGNYSITVEPAGYNLDGSVAGGGSATSNGSEDGSNAATTENTAATGTSTESTSVPQTGDALPMFALAAGLLIVGLALALLMRAAYLRRQA